MSILLTLQNLNLSFGSKFIFKDATLTLNREDKIGLIGLNGQGKSTLFKVLTEELVPNQSEPPFTYDKLGSGFRVFLVPQELDHERFGDLAAEDYYLAFYPKLYALSQKLKTDPSNDQLLASFEEAGGWEIQNNYVNYLKGFGLPHLNRAARDLSGGEQRKMALSAGLSSPYELILWDEPTNHLDIETIERFEDELLKSKKTYMIISHDRYLLNNTTNRILHIEAGLINSFSGNYLEYLVYLEEREAERVRILKIQENKHRRELAWMRQGIKARGTRSKKRVENFHQLSEQISEQKAKAKKRAQLSLEHSGRKSKSLVELREGAFSYPKAETQLLIDLNLGICKKDKIALMGPNGVGKSTLIKILSGKLPLTQGKLKSADHLNVVVFDQNRAELEGQLTLKEVVAQGTNQVLLGNGQNQHVNTYLGKFLFSKDQVDQPVSRLSGGEKNRLQLALFMKQRADLWVFDEPTNDLDMETIELLERELKNYEAAVIIISHDRAFLDNTCKSCWLIHDQSVEVFEGGYTQVAPYLHALEEEKEWKSKNPAPQKKKEKKIKLSFHEKKRLAVIEEEVEAAEEKLAGLDEALAQFDFTQMTEAKNKEYRELEEGRRLQKDLVDKHYSEWEELNQKAEESTS